MPLHGRISQVLDELIKSGQLAAGEQLPPERELAELFGVSLAPVRQAILDAVNRGLLVRERGRGTFVRRPGFDQKLSILHSLTESLRDQHIEVDTQVLRQETVPTPPEVTHALGARHRKAVLLERLACAGGTPVALLEAYLSARTYPELAYSPLTNGSLYETLRERYGTVVTWSESMIELERCAPPETEKLDVPVGEPLLRVEGTAFAESGQPVEYYRVRYRADRVRFFLESHRASDRVVRLKHAEEQHERPAGGARKMASSARRSG
jgi:GntR family transcriptional regulator